MQNKKAIKNLPGKLIFNSLNKIQQGNALLHTLL